MSALNSHFRFRIIDAARSVEFIHHRHFRIYPTSNHWDFPHSLTGRQEDMLRIAAAVHLADGWVGRSKATNGHRAIVMEIEVLDPTFWSDAKTYDRLKRTVDFVSGNDDWEFRFIQSTSRPEQQPPLFRPSDPPVVCLYSGGLDSAAGLAARLSATPDQDFLPVTVRHQFQKSKMIREHFSLLEHRGLARGRLHPFEVGAFLRNRRIGADHGARLREVTHRCRPMVFMVVAGLVAHSAETNVVEVYESGVGSINVPLLAQAADFRATRSTHPTFLRRMSELMSCVNDEEVRYELPFADLTKAEMVGRLKALDLEDLACRSVSCILHPLRRPDGRHCGKCAACVFRRQAMLVAGIEEFASSYHVDVFRRRSREKDQRWLRAFRQQATRLAALETGEIPAFFRRHLVVTGAASTETEIAGHAEVHRRYQKEWHWVLRAIGLGEQRPMGTDREERRQLGASA